MYVFPKREQALSRKLRKEDNMDTVNELRHEINHSGGDEDHPGAPSSDRGIRSILRTLEMPILHR